jgi:hypothetical protein
LHIVCSVVDFKRQDGMKSFLKKVRIAELKAQWHSILLKLCSQIDLSKMTDKLVNESMVQQRVLNEVNIHCDRGLRHPSIVRVSN